ncbi:hypothetical protein FOB58_000628 [Candida parapsilosis]|uniref:Uncharacterized protein n=2 Tax=Candida parapsilosis TaxID=5480 RepID=G8BCZ9_CANPC|nr:uncharacterized protein CPAR2_207870 [Candida parapsilosis]KAF6054706.1 hypothetical protein FOB58_000628 [Candida parapsilosis]KAF6056268.1 hypothetical protein FOB59_000780 [Candida parapsilosis]KAF6059201.1 hypothetical protein FOB60_000783 [Candida parapsilosis]KAF6067958.1 hypothetical protein FOB61_000783 [Candida parapsilosis]KAI5911478.1 hypothetical protein K4G61_g5181 [Candida parapsilosis]
MCKTEICGICQHKSWTGCGKHVSEIMDITSKDEWCTCEPLDETEAVYVEGHGSYPPKAGQGFRRCSTDSNCSRTSSNK